MFRNADKLVSLLDKMIRRGGEDWKLEEVSRSRWVPNGSHLDLDLELLMSRTSRDITVDEAMAIIDDLILKGQNIGDAVSVDLDEKLKDLVTVTDDAEDGSGEGGEAQEAQEAQDTEGSVAKPTDGMSEDDKALLALVLGDSLLPNGENSDQAKDSAGGWNNPDEDDRTPQGAMRSLENVLRRLMVESDGDEAEGRLHYPGVAARLLTKQAGFHRERKVERGRKAVLILPDVSGSCADVCGLTMSVANRLARDNDKILVLPHSNGWYNRGEQDGLHASWAGKIPDTMNNPDEWITWLENSGREISWVFALGDHDAENLYKRLAQVPGLNGVLWINPMRRRGTQDSKISNPADKIAYTVSGDSAQEVGKGLTKALQYFLSHR